MENVLMAKFLVAIKSENEGGGRDDGDLVRGDGSGDGLAKPPKTRNPLTGEMVDAMIRNPLTGELTCGPTPVITDKSKLIVKPIT